MERSELLAYLDAEVEKLAESVYPSTGDAFAHVAVREYFDLDDEDALEYCDVGGSHDKGVDAVWFDDENRRMVVVQAKWTNSDKAFQKDAVRDIEGAYRWLVHIANGKSTEAAPRVVAAARRLHDLREVEPDFPVQLFAIAAGSFTRGAAEEAARVNEDLQTEPAQAVLVSLDDLLEEIEIRLDQARGIPSEFPTVTFRLSADEYFEHRADPRALVATLSGEELAKAAQDHGYRLFIRNLRFLLPTKAKGSVNAVMERTLKTKGGRERFWYYNNGIAIVCAGYELDPEQHKVTVHDMQIVNGAQTTTTLGAVLEALRNEPPASVLARIIATDDDELQENVTFYNNRQNAVRDRDLQSNDEAQDRLQKEFLDLTPPWFYERKRGEWNAVSTNNAKLKRRVGNGRRRLDNERTAQAAYAFYFDAAKARADKKNLFQTKNAGGYYDDVFNSSRTAIELLVPYLIAEYVRARKNEYLKQLRGIDEKRASNADKRVLAREWLKFADQFIVGTVAFLMEKRGGHSEERLNELLANNFDDMLKGVYAAAVRDLSVLFIRKQQEAKKAETPFSYANYVKGNWEEVLAHLDAEWDAREAVGDPLEGVPMLAEE